MQSPFISVDASLQVNNPEPTCQPQTGHSIWITHSTHTIPLTSPISYIWHFTRICRRHTPHSPPPHTSSHYPIAANATQRVFSSPLPLYCLSCVIIIVIHIITYISTVSGFARHRNPRVRMFSHSALVALRCYVRMKWLAAFVRRYYWP